MLLLSCTNEQCMLSNLLPSQHCTLSESFKLSQRRCRLGELHGAASLAGEALHAILLAPCNQGRAMHLPWHSSVLPTWHSACS